MDVLVLMESSRSGLAEILTMANRPVAPPRWIPATTALFMSLNLDPPKLMDQTLRMMAQQDPETAQSIEMQLRQGPPGPDGQPMNLREALINRLTGPLVGLVSFREPYDANSMQALLALGHSNQQGLTSLITMLMSMVGGATPRDFQGTQIYANPMAGSVALTPDQLYWGNAPAVEGAVSAGQSGGGLMEKDDFRNAARLVPDEAWLVTYIDAREVLRAMAHLGDKVRSGQIPPDSLAGQLMFMMQMSGQETPKPDEIDKRMKDTAAQIMTISTTSDGLRMTAVTLNPPKSEGGSAN
jgi:hypothetical protein